MEYLCYMLGGVFLQSVLIHSHVCAELLRICEQHPWQHVFDTLTWNCLQTIFSYLLCLRRYPTCHLCKWVQNMSLLFARVRDVVRTPDVPTLI